MAGGGGGGDIIDFIVYTLHGDRAGGRDLNIEIRDIEQQQ